MREKTVDGVVLREVRPGVWVGRDAEVWLENVPLQGTGRQGNTRYGNRWWTRKPGSKSRVSITTPRGKWLRYRLVAEAWVHNPCPQCYTVINHIDGDPTNDCADNLEWCDQSHNVQHGYDTGLNITRGRRFTEDEELQIVEHYNSLPKRVIGFNRSDYLADYYGCGSMTIKRIIKKHRNKG